MDTRSIDPNVRIGHVHLKAADLESALRLYHGVLGFEVTQGYGQDAGCSARNNRNRPLWPSACCTARGARAIRG
jgi:hypothetical protein